MKSLVGLLVLWLGTLISLFLVIDGNKTPISTASSNTVVTAPAPLPSINQYEVEILTSEYREDLKIKGFTHDKQLCDWSKSRLGEIETDWSHDGFQKYTKIYQQYGYRYIGENLAADISNAGVLVGLWKASESHNANLINPRFTHTCVRCSDNYCVQLFGGK